MGNQKSSECEDSGQAGPAKASLELVASRLKAIEVGQVAMNNALGLIIDTLHVQTNLLRKLSEYTADEVAPSPILKTLNELTEAIMQLDASIGSVEKKFDQLSGILALAFGVPSTRSVYYPDDGMG
jgi:hypothetical protein